LASVGLEVEGVVGFTDAEGEGAAEVVESAGVAALAGFTGVTGVVGVSGVVG